MHHRVEILTQFRVAVPKLVPRGVIIKALAEDVLVVWIPRGPDSEDILCSILNGLLDAGSGDIHFSSTPVELVTLPSKTPTPTPTRK